MSGIGNFTEKSEIEKSDKQTLKESKWVKEKTFQIRKYEL